MNKIGICILSIGDEFILETINLINSVKANIEYNFKFYIGTDKPDNFIGENITTILITDEFNYNLKRIPLEKSLNECDIVIFLDSDSVALRNVDFKNLEEVDDALYGLIYNDYNYENLKEYHDVIFDMNNNDKNIPYIFEYIFIIKLNDQNKKNNFIENWNMIFNETQKQQPLSKFKNGSNEGLIIGLSCLMSDIKIVDPIVNSEMFQYFGVFHHYGEQLDKLKYFSYILPSVE